MTRLKRCELSSPKLISAVKFNWAFCLLPLALSCAPAETKTESEENFLNMGEIQRKASFCANKMDQCQTADGIVSKAGLQADNYFPAQEDPSDIDGKRDAFRHVVSMVWITLSYGNEFARGLTDATDPDPKSYKESNPQVVCQRQMDRTNNNYAILNATKMARECDIPTNRRATKSDWEDYDHQAKWTCIAQSAAEVIRASKSTSPGPVVIARDPNNATKCWIVPSSTNIGSRGRPKSEGKGY